MSDFYAEHVHPHSHEHSHTDKSGGEIVHSHEHSHDHIHSHEHGDEHHHHGAHSHTHSPEQVKAVLNRLSRAIGHLEAVKNMVADGRDCSEVLVQLSAVRSAINNTGLLILQDHINHCIVDAVQEGDMNAVSDLTRAIGRYFK